MINIIDSPGATPLSDDEANELIPKHITTQSELNQWEQSNILEATQWLLNQKNHFIDEKFLLALHKKMFYKTWKWAGKFRNSNKNIGVDKSIIAMELRNLLNDVNYQIENNVYTIEEIAVRFHHRLVKIHLFSNGNGRHTRLSTDHLLRLQGFPNFTWGQGDLTLASETRNHYIQALKQADRNDYAPLLKFVRS